MKQILLYGYIYSLMAKDLINDLANADQDEVTVRINTGGGEVEAGWGIISNLRDYPGKMKLKVDGAAHSMGLATLAFFEDVEAIDVSQFLLHRAAYPSWIEQRDDFKGSAMEGMLIDMNNSIEKALRNKIDVKAFEEIKGVKLKEVFSMDDRLDIMLTAKEAKKIGLINKITKITPTKRAEISQFAAAASAGDSHMKADDSILIPELSDDDDSPENSNNKGNLNNNSKTKINKKMILEDFKKENPEAYAAMQKQIVEQERDRIGAWLTYVDVDAEAVKKGIESGDEISRTQMADFQRKVMSMQVAAKVEDENVEDLDTEDEKPKTEAPESKSKKEFDDLDAKVRAEMGLKPETQEK